MRFLSILNKFMVHDLKCFRSFSTINKSENKTHSLHPARYFQSQQHVIHSLNTHYTRWGIFNHNSMPFILQILITPGGVFSITTACHSFSKRSLHSAGYFQSQQHAILQTLIKNFTHSKLYFSLIICVLNRNSKNVHFQWKRMNLTNLISDKNYDVYVRL
jgi:hypothetical protein